MYKVLMIGQLLATGTKYLVGSNAVGPYRVTSADQAGQFFGVGSQLHRMAKFWFLNNRITPLYVVALKDNGTSKAVGTFAFTGPATVAGTVHAYINGEHLQVPVVATDTATIVGDALAALITANTSLPVTAIDTTGSVAISAKNAGIIGNDIDIRLNYNEGEALPTGIGCTVTAMATGATDPSVQDAINLLGDEWYNIIIGPYVDATSLVALETELSSRFGPLRMIDGLYISSKRGTLSVLSVFGNARNSPHISIMCAGGVVGGGNPTWTAEIAAAYGGQLAYEGQIDPARPFQRLQLVGVLAPAISERFDFTERNSLLYDGISTNFVTTDGRVLIERAITMYQRNNAGAEDIAYLDVNTMLTLMYLRYDFRTKILTKYPRAKLADDGVQVGPGQQIITPKIGKAEAIAIFRAWEYMGLVENISQFKQDLTCVRSIVDPNRLEWVLPPDLVNQFMVGAATIQFLLQSPTV
jgi:phage tail sheath gpL-like